MSGEYRVALPDGRVQIVTYTADENGYRPYISYVKAGEPHGNGHHNHHTKYTTAPKHHSFADEHHHIKGEERHHIHHIKKPKHHAGPHRKSHPPAVSFSQFNTFHGGHHWNKFIERHILRRSNLEEGKLRMHMWCIDTRRFSAKWLGKVFLISLARKKVASEGKISNLRQRKEILKIKLLIVFYPCACKRHYLESICFSRTKVMTWFPIEIILILVWNPLCL